MLDLVQEHVDGLDLRYSSKQTTYRAIRSFFAHNRADLPKDLHYKIRSDKEPVKTTLTLQDVKDVLLSSNKTYRAIFISMFQGGMDLSAFEYWNSNGWESMKKQLRGDPETIKIDLPGRKKRRNKQGFYTFIGTDAIKAIQDYLDSGKRPDGPGPIFWNNNKPVKAERAQHYWLQHLIRLGKVKRETNGTTSTRYGKNIHEIRDLFRSQWEKSPAKGIVAEFCMGHAVDPLGYNKAVNDDDWTREQYLLALPMLEIISSARPYGLIKVSHKQMAFQDEFQQLLEDKEVQEKFLKFLDSLKK